MDHQPIHHLNWTKLLGWVLSLAALGFVVRWLWTLDRRAWQTFSNLNLWWLIGSTVVWIAWFLVRFWLWERISQRHGFSSERHQNIRMWALSEMMRYIPGNVWSFGARYQGAVKGGTSKRGAFQALVLEAVSLVAGATVVSLAVIPTARWLVVGIAGVIIYLIIIPFLLPLIWKKFHIEEQIPVPRIEFFWLLLGYTVVWILYGVANVMIYRAFPHMPTVGIFFFMGINVLSWLVGYVSIITPMGLGVREVTFVGLARTFLSASIAGTMALISRIWMVVSELVFVSGVLIFFRPRS